MTSHSAPPPSGPLLPMLCSPFTQKCLLIPSLLMFSHLLLLHPAQQLPAVPQKSMLKFSAFRSLPLSPHFHKGKINTIGLETARILYCSHLQDYQRYVKIPKKCEPVLCHCWETLNPWIMGQPSTAQMVCKTWFMFSLSYLQNSQARWLKLVQMI